MSSFPTILFYSILFPVLPFILLLFALLHFNPFFQPFLLFLPTLPLYFLIFSPLFLFPLFSSLLLITIPTLTCSLHSFQHHFTTWLPSQLFTLLSFLSSHPVGFSNEDWYPLIVMGLRTLTRYHIPGTYSTLHYTALHYTALHYTTLHYTTLYSTIHNMILYNLPTSLHHILVSLFLSSILLSPTASPLNPLIYILSHPNLTSSMVFRIVLCCAV